jgi:hypothetical protein
MDFVHACSFCGWGRGSATPVRVPAGCPRCGCAVDSLDAAEARRRAHAVDALAPLPASAASLGVRLAVCAFALALVVAAARLGHGVADLNGAIAGVGVAGFLLLPFVPERLPG